MPQYTTLLQARLYTNTQIQTVQNRPNYLKNSSLEFPWNYLQGYSFRNVENPKI